ncbi:uncharacterized protein LY89DRAFT_726057 [Mollisia scopiformis]|uniref:Uncharacterized protein n=1 Tax=Mollisia scopiformis TaxID=149040 RepID=A0A132B4I4_MOLSC|nr:uncharacterized protein LY89DRAFT_726057 [Mollisia scopiformis]KUJ06919.1 hypothetical protein LY89DRAFT_726057 [Mollisia scopiformis]
MVREWMNDPYSYEPNFVNKSDEDQQAMILLAWVFRADSKHQFLEHGIKRLFDRSTNESLPAIPDNWPLPADMMENIAKARHKAIMDLCSLAYKYVNYLKDGQSDICPTHNQKCKVIIARYFMQMLGDLYLRKTKTFQKSVHVIFHRPDYLSITFVKLEQKFLTCDEAMQRVFNNKSIKINNQIWKRLWESCRPIEQANPPIAVETNRIEKATGEWRKWVKRERGEEWSDY